MGASALAATAHPKEPCANSALGCAHYRLFHARGGRCTFARCKCAGFVAKKES